MSTLNNAMITIQLRMAMMTHDFGMKTTWGNYPTASTGPGLVRMPFFDANDPVQCKAAMGFGLHEGSHHRYQSDFSLMSVAAQMGKFYTHMLNVFEDARVDRNALREYPGIKSEYAAIEELFIQRNQRKPATQADGVVSVLCSYLSIYLGCKVLGYEPLSPLWDGVRAEAGKLFTQGLLTKVEIIADMAARSPSSQGPWECVLMLADSIRDELETLKNQTPPPSTGDDADPTAGTAGGDDADDANSTSGTAGGDDADDADSTAGTAGGDDADDADSTAGTAGDDDADDADPTAGTTGDDADDANPTTGAAGGGDADDADPTAGQTGKEHAVKVLEELLSNIENNEGCDELPEDKGQLLGQLIKAEPSMAFENPLRPSLDRVHQETGKSTRLRSVKVASRPLSDALSELIETETQVAPGCGRRGKRFLTSRMNRYMHGDMKVYRTKAMSVGIDSALMLLLDLSGSMQDVETTAKDACLALALAVQEIGGADVAMQSFGYTNHDLIGFGECVEDVSSRLEHVNADGGTPMREGLSNALLALLPHEAAQKSLIVITDGESDTPCDETIKLIRSQDIEIFGVFIGQYAKGRSHMDRHFTPGGWIAVSSVNDLKRELFKLAKSTVLAVA